MPDATEWLVGYNDEDAGRQYDQFATFDEAMLQLRRFVVQGKAALLYQRVPFEMKVDVTVHAPRKRRKTLPPAAAPDSDTPTGPGNGEAGEPKAPEKGHTPVDDGGASAGGPVLQTGPDGCQSAEENREIGSGDASDGEKDGAPKPESAPIPTRLVTIRKEVDTHAPASVTPTTEGAERCPAPSPVSLWACEVDTYAGDPPCPGPILYDPATHGRFCAVHMIGEVSVRAEWHRRNAARNRPLRIAHAG